MKSILTEEQDATLNSGEVIHAITSPIHDRILPDLENAKIAIIGLGYVGLPLATAFGGIRDTVGFDIDPARVVSLIEAQDIPGRAAAGDAAALRFSNIESDLADRDIFIVAVPTPVDANRIPDFSPLIAASALVGRAIRPGGLAIFESTVYPGATEDVCVPVIEAHSGLAHNRDFHVGYSPERINPGERERGLADVVKITSGSTPAAAALVDALYRQVVRAGTYPAPSIRVAEMAKVVENVQRDLNIALVNDVALLCHRLEIDSGDVLAAAGTKWNFLPFRPGLVGGHCIGIDPYYLAFKAQAVEHSPDLILAARRVNEVVPLMVADRVLAMLSARDIAVQGARILVLGLSYKENCADVRNTRVIELVGELLARGAEVDIHDPVADAVQSNMLYRCVLRDALDAEYDAVILAVAHDEFLAMGAAGLRKLVRPGGVLFDVKQVLPRDAVDGRL